MKGTDFWCVGKNSGKPIYFNNFWMVVVKNRHDLLGLGTLKSVSQE